ncbi:MAG TPA: small multi-drug export protein [Draconibacterium sp.]|nr:small multi-drug export protein [Draconibacterium sp.]
MGITSKFLIVYLAGATGMWKGIPAGIALGIHPIYNGLFTALGSITSVLLLCFAGDSFRNRILKLYGQKRIEKKKGKFLKLTDRYGALGLGLITTGLLGPFNSLLIGFILFKDLSKFLLYLIIGILVWSIILAYIFTPLIELISKIQINL